MNGRRARGNEPNIYRYEHNGARSWVVQLKRVGESYVKYFADGADGPEASLESARTFRDDLRDRLPPWHKLHRRHSTNTSGIIGVSRVIDRTRTGTLVPRWVAMWHRTDGKRLKRSFSVFKYGEREAKRLAIEARRRGVEDLLLARAPDSQPRIPNKRLSSFMVG